MMKHSLLVEAFLTAPHGQLDGFRRVGQELRPVFKPETRSSEDLATLSTMHKGALAYCEDLLNAYGPHILDVPVDLMQIQEPLRLLAERELRISSEVASALRVESDFTGVGEFDVGIGLAVAE